jgi:hypothetical protein
MPTATDKRTIAIVTACLRADGLSTFARTQVEVTPDEAENGVHFYLAEAELLERGFEEPMVHFAQEEAPDFLFPAVEQFLGVTPEPYILVYPEKT